MPSVLHLFWRPDPSEEFIQPGSFRLWIETDTAAAAKGTKPTAPVRHPRHLAGEELTAWLRGNAGLPTSPAAFEPLSAGKKAKPAAKKSVLNLDELIEYRYDLALDGESVTPEEWARLVEAKTPLVQFRGQWVALDRDRMKEMLEFWRQQGESGEALDIHELLRRTAEDSDIFEVDPLDALSAMLGQLPTGAGGADRGTPCQPARIPKARRGLAGLPGKAGIERLPGRRHGPRQDHSRPFMGFTRSRPTTPASN